MAWRRTLQDAVRAYTHVTVTNLVHGGPSEAGDYSLRWPTVIYTYGHGAVIIQTSAWAIDHVQ